MKRKQYLWCWLVLFLLLQLLPLAGLSWAGFPDAYEPDNSLIEAQGVVVNPSIDTQQHSFHQYFDEDWFIFFCRQGGAKGPNYRIYATPLTGDSDPVIELFAPDGKSLLVKRNEAGPGEQELLGFKCLEDGYYFVRFTNNSLYFGTDVSYTIFMDYFFYILNLPNGYIEGRVTSDGVGLGGVKITVGSGVGASQSNGAYIVSGVAGDVTLSLRKDGYYPKDLTVPVVGNQTTHLDIELEKIPIPSRPPAISGTPATVARFDELYSFIPTATDPDGDSIAFSISNKPPWAYFNPDNGILVGVPTAQDAGRYGPIVITASDSQGMSASLPQFFIQVKQIMSPGIFMLLNKEE